MSDNLKQAIAHLSKDPILAKAMQQTEVRAPRHQDDVYFVLMRSICGQQLSTKAAATIWNRFLDLFEDRYPKAELVTNMDDQVFRSAGLSFQKTGYLKNIAQFHLDGKMDAHVIHAMDDETAIKHLTQIKGVGKWTVEMLLMFSLGRPNVFPVDDLGIRQGIIKLYNLDLQGKALISKLHEIAKPWQPFRTYACNLIWDYKDGV